MSPVSGCSVPSPGDAPRVLMSAYACGPGRGSEPGMGWRWVTHLAEHCRLTVITEAEFQDPIRAALEGGRFTFPPEFHFIDIGTKARRRCANQGDWRFYLDYRRWQKRAFALAERLARGVRFDLCHQLNMIGFREPGYLWQLDVPLIWGPVGGYELMPWRFLPSLGVGPGAYHALRNILSAIQVRTSARVRACARRAAVVLAATPSNQGALARVRGGPVMLMAEVAGEPCAVRRRRARGQGPLRLVWSGRALRGKMLPIALDALALAGRGGRFELHVVGGGCHMPGWRKRAVEAGVDLWCVWHGVVDRSRALEIMSDCDALLFTSLLEGTSSVVLEALGLGVPVVCHERCGMAVAVTDGCGIKIPAHSYRRSVEGFASAMVRMEGDQHALEELSRGALRRAVELNWTNRVRTLVGIYDSLRCASQASSPASTSRQGPW